jgi:microsomal dipeptidase-like Zn-dependent dipeptidase
MEAVDKQLDYIKQMERYIDAQNGVPGKGWFRIVYSSDEARQVISQGKLAVILGIEVATIFNIPTDDFKKLSDQKKAEAIQLAKDTIITQLDNYYKEGVRSIYPIHGFNNAFGGTAMFVPGIYNIGNRIKNGEYFEPCECPGPEQLSPGEEYTFHELSASYALSDPFFKLLAPALGWAIPFYPEMAANCNSRGLTDLGGFFIDEMIKRNMIIEIDHMSSRMFNGYIDEKGVKVRGVIDICKEKDYPVVSSHAAVVDGKGDEASKTLENIRTIHNLGGIVAPILIQGDEGLEDKYIDGPYCKISTRGWANVYKYICDAMEKEGGFVGVPLSTDFNGFATLPSPRFGEKACSGTGEQQKETAMVEYPFTPHFGSGKIDRLKTGNRVFDINFDGVANYGLIPDFVEEVKKVGLTDKDLEPLFNSAEAYLRMWKKVESK